MRLYSPIKHKSFTRFRQVHIGIKTLQKPIRQEIKISLVRLKCPCHKMRVHIFEIYDTKYTEIRKQNRN